MKIKKTSGPRITIYECTLLGLAIILAILAIWFTTVISPQSNFTQFWMLPSPQTANGCAVRIGVHNFESTTIEYRITITMNGALLHTWPSVVLAPQEEWDQVVSLSPRRAGNLYVKGQLYQSNQPATVYNEVHFMLQFLRKSKNGKALQCRTA